MKTPHGSRGECARLNRWKRREVTDSVEMDADGEKAGIVVNVLVTF